MSRAFLLFFVCIPLAASGNSVAMGADGEHPEDVLNFFKPGMYVEVNSLQGHPAYQLVIFDVGQQQYEAEQERRRKRLMENFERASDSRRSEAQAEPSVGMKSFFLLGTVQHADDDYLVLAYGEGKSFQQVIPAQYISRIRWHTAPKPDDPSEDGDAATGSN